ncbi:MAG: recombinase family protein [Planctomycetota bacterium]
MVCTSLSLGYTGQDVPGQFTKQKRPRQKIVIDPETAPWIKKIFDWYVAGKSMDRIAQDLNSDPNAPAPNKSLTGIWTHELVRKHLMNPVYRGFWRYGAKETEWLSKKDYAKQVERDEPLKSQQMEYLRIISDEQWYRVQELLANEKKKSGRKPPDSDRAARPRVLRQLFVCPAHGRKLVAGGPYGRSLLCLLCRATKAEDRPLYTHLNRQLTLQLTCETLVELIQSDSVLVQEIIAACQQAAESVQKPDPERLSQLRSEAKKLMSKVEFNRRSPGESDAEQKQTELLLKELRGQHATVSAELAALESAQSNGVVVPTVEEVTSLLDELSQTIAGASFSENEDDTRIARRIIDLLTGGQIDLYQMGERSQNKGWLQGRFFVDVISVVSSQLTGMALPAGQKQGKEVIIDYRAEKIIDSQAEEAKALYDEGLLCKQIAKQMGKSRGYITGLIQHWFRSRGLSAPDGRQRRETLPAKQESLPLYRQLADEAVQLADQGLPYLVIAGKLKTSDTIIAKAISWWNTSRNLPVPTADDRRKKTLSKAKELYEQGVLIKDMAPGFNYGPRGLTLALRKFYAELGETMPDGRSRRGNARSGEQANGNSAD